MRWKGFVGYEAFVKRHAPSGKKILVFRNSGIDGR